MSFTRHCMDIFERTTIQFYAVGEKNLSFYDSDAQFILMPYTYIYFRYMPNAFNDFKHITCPFDIWVKKKKIKNIYPVLY